ITLDTQPPTTGTITVNGGAQYTRQTSITLNLQATDSGSGVSQMSFSQDGVTYTAPEAYNTSKTWTFSTGDGNKTVWVKFKDLSGLWSNPVSVTVLLDTTVPTGSMNINSGAQYADSLTVTLNLSAQDTGSGIDKMSFSNDNITYSTPEAYATTKIYTLPTGDGSKTVYVAYFDKAGNVSQVYSKSITLDSTAPTITNIASSLSSNGVTISWTTDKPSDTQIDYGLTTSYESNTTLDPALVTAHAQTLNNLQVGATYHYRVKSRNQTGKLETSPDFTFTVQNPQDTISETGLAGYWNFENLTSNTVSDKSGGSNNGTLVNNPPVSTDHPPLNFTNTRSLSFDGFDDYVRVPNSASLQFGTGSFTIVLWMKPDTVATPRQAIVDKADGTNGFRFITSNEDGDRLKFIRGVYFADGVQSNDGVLTAGLWQHVVAVVDTSLTPQVSFYVNGVYAGGGNLPANGRIATTTTDLFIGRKGYDVSGVYYFDGNMDDVRIYNRALSQTEVQNLAQGNLHPTLAPVIAFSSPASTANSNYTLTYTVDGVATSETWKLTPGANELLVNALVPGKPPAFVKYTVTLTQTEPSVPAMPEVPVLSGNLVSVTTQDGLILKYDQGTLVAIEKPNEYELYFPTLDTNGNLTGGLLLFSSGDKLLYENSVPIYQISAGGDKTYYDPDGTVRAFETSSGEKTRFAYRTDAQGKIISLLALETSRTSLYEASGKPVWVSMTDGTDIRYENGILKEYRDASGNRYQYEITQLLTNGTLTGYRSELIGIIPAGSWTPMSYAQIQGELASYPSVKQTLEQKLAKSINYDVSGKILEFDSGNGEILSLQNSLPTSLRDKTGSLTLIASQVSSNGILSSINLDETSNPDQTFDSNGNLSSIRLSDGSVLQVTSLKVDEIVTQDGSVLSSLIWNGSSLTGFIRTKVDGSKEIYQSSRLIQKIDASGVTTNYIAYGSEDRPDTMTTVDGRTYQFIQYTNAQGLPERKTELISMDLEDGSRIEFKNGSPTRYIQTKQVQMDPYSVPDLPQGESYVPSVIVGNGIELRSLTIDSTGLILTGEALFPDGTQYIIQNGSLLKQITPFGTILEPQAELPSFEAPEPILKDSVLSPGEWAYRNELLRNQLAFFQDGVGIDTLSGMPLDNYNGATSQASDYSQATLIGFYAEILAAIATGGYFTNVMSQQEAYQRLQNLLVETYYAQSQAGWNGMFAFFKIAKDPATGKPVYSRYGDTIGIGDNLNLSVSLSSVIGAMRQNYSSSDPLRTYRDNIMSYAEVIISSQETGYARFYDSQAKKFQMAYNPTRAQFSGYMDRVFNEFRTGLIWLASRNSTYRQAVDNLDVTIRPYTTEEGKTVELAVPFDGNTFQMFWPLIHVDETKYPEFEVALRNFLYAQAEYVSRNNTPGLLSAGDDVTSGYNGKIGLPEAAETDDPLVTNVGSLYGTASAYPLAPHYTLQFLKNVETLFPGIKTDKGYVDALKLGTPTVVDGQTIQNPVYSSKYFGVDQASFFLSILGKSQDYFSYYLETQNLRSSFDSTYKSMSFNLKPVAEFNPEAPSFGSSLPTLYTGTSQAPDGRSNELVKQPALISQVTDPDFGVGQVFNYLNPEGKFHHIEIEFSEAAPAGGGEGILKMNLGEYLLLPGRSDLGRSVLESFQLDLLNQSTSQGAFFTQGQGYANQAIITDPQIGEARVIDFDLRQVEYPVGLWALYSGLDLSKYDYLSIPIRLGSNTPNGVGAKIELKGLGEVLVTGPLTSEWQYFQIPIVKPAGLLSEIAVSIQSQNGSPVLGELYLGPLSAFKIRTTRQVDWVSTIGMTDAALSTLLKTKVITSSTGGGFVTAQEILENFTLDSEGKLIDGILHLADGGTQYFKRGKLMKWVFRNGRTVLFENGLASFALDLAHGTLLEGRFYYDQSLNGTVRSFILQDNNTKKIFGSDGLLKTMVSYGQTINFAGGVIDSILTPTATLTNVVFADDKTLLRAHVKMNDGREFDIDQSTAQVINRPNGVKVYYLGNYITAIETTQNGRTDFTYRTNAQGQVTGVDATFNEVPTDPLTIKTISLFEYIYRPERTLETAEILKNPLLHIIPTASVSSFSYPGAIYPPEYVSASPGNFDGMNSQAKFTFKYNSTTGPYMGMSIKHPSEPVSISDYGFVILRLAEKSTMTWAQDFNFELKNSTGWAMYTFQAANAPNQYKSYEFSLAGKVGTEAELTLLAIREPGGVGQDAVIYIGDIAYVSLKILDHPIWEDEIGFTRAQAQDIKIESDLLTQVGEKIAQKKPLVYTNLVSFLNLPTTLIYTDVSTTRAGELVQYKRFDGAQVTLSGQNVTKVILPDGTINEYFPSTNSAQGLIHGDTDQGNNTLEYQYGNLRKTTQPDGHELTFTYEFDTDGGEITVITDSVSGDVRRFKEGKLLNSTTQDNLKTNFTYQNGKLSVAELTYKNRVLDSTRYYFNDDETQVTDERGTTWFYDSKGNLTKHLTKDGYLFEYVDYSQSLDTNVLIDPSDYKNQVFTATDLRASRLRGYESTDGSQLLFNDDDLGEIKLINGDQAVNLVFDSQGRIRTGQVQLANGVVISIGDYLPVSGRRADNSVFNLAFPASGEREILFREDGSFESFKITLDGHTYYYDIEGKLTKVVFPDFKQDEFTYTKNLSGVITSYEMLDSAPVVFRGVPYPKAVTLKSEGTGAARKLSLLDGTTEVTSKTGSGFIASVFLEDLGTWNTVTGSFASAADRFALKSFLTGVKQGQYVSAMVSDSALQTAGTSTERNEIFSLLESMGAGRIREAATNNQDWSFFGMKGLNIGEASEEVKTLNSIGTSSSVKQTITNTTYTAGMTFNGVLMYLNAPVSELNSFTSFLSRYKTYQPDYEIQALSVYNSKDELVYSERLDGVRTYYQNGKAKETFDQSGELLYSYEYDANGNQIRINIIKAEADFNEKMAEVRAKVEQEKFDALYDLSWRDEAARLQIKEQVNEGLQAIDNGIATLESQRFQDVKVCKSAFLWFGKKCKHITVEVPGVADAINNLRNERVNLLETQERELGKIASEVESKRLEVETSLNDQMAQLDEEEWKFKDNVLHQEMDPVIISFYRDILGRDPSTDEINQWVNTYRSSG
ncbi:MAG: hypothetical protein HYS55_01855, partial [Candidatus Omnitrophica bacterium]|nr:hypothetical protein [Candidatus Omnitrophota bacterium]